ncbi:hypothetical protein [Rhizobacter sp. Root1221]|uniref:hypothetical protein n=1 Tax=Rhizobacter sp. Root1221 TaxID=1736433 RepID=UPI0006F32655|nr:hypothetical protein [Rhizobacter sp. Root1221]KQV81162.1 hypothetical protein ASC87_09530 [Rhizobacter sp. Root1221]
MRLPIKSALRRVTALEDDQPLSALIQRRAPAARDAGTPLAGLPAPRLARMDDATQRPRVKLPPAAATSLQAPEAPAPPKAPAAAEPGKAPRQPTVGERMNVLWFSGKKGRQAEFDPVMTAYQGTLKDTKPLSGGKFLAMILELTKSKKAKPFDTGHPLIQGYSIRVPGTQEEVHILRRDEPNGFPGDIRRLGKVTPEALGQLTKVMDTGAGMSSSTSARRRGGEKLSLRAPKLWSGKRKTEFTDLHNACKKNTDASLSGPRFLDMLYRLTMEPGVKGTKVSVPDADAGVEIERFDITVPGAGPAQVLRRLDEDQELADLRLAPPEASEGYVLDEMVKSAKSSDAQKSAAPRTKDNTGATSQNQRHWSIWRSLAKHVNGEYEACRLHAQRNDESTPTGSGFVKHLNELCDDAPAVEVDAEHGITRHVIKPDGCDKSIIVLRRKDEQGLLAGMRKIDDNSKTAEAVKEMIANIRESKAEASPAGPSAPAKRPLGVKAEMPAGKKPRPQATELKLALEMKQVLQLMLENRNRKRPLLDGVEAKTRLSGASLRSWFGPDGSLSGKRTPGSFMRLNGYFGVRDDLQLLFEKLGQHALADALPQQMTAALLAQTLKARIDNPTIATAAPLAKIVKANPKVVEKSIDARTGALLISNDALLEMPDYAEHWLAIKAALKALGQRDRAKKLKAPEAPAVTIMRDLEGSLRRVAAAADAMRREQLLSAEAAQREGVSPELLDLVVGPGGALRNAQEIANRLPGFNAEQRPELDGLVAQLQSPASSGMSRVLVRRIKKTSAKLFIVRSGDAASGTKETQNLAKVFAHSPDLVRSARPFTAERPRQALRWLATVLRSRFNDAVEITTYYDRKRREIWVSSNKREVNEEIQAFLSDTNLQRQLAKRGKLDHASRNGRHETKLRGMLADPSARPHSAQAREVIEVMSEGRFRVPVERFELDGQELDYHSGRRIKAAFTHETGEALNLATLAGTMRPCGTCADVLGLPDDAHRGPFWRSRSAHAFTDMETVVKRNIALSIGSSVTKMRDSQLSVHYDTESDSDADVPGRLVKREPEPAAGAALPFGLSPAWGDHRPRRPAQAPVRNAAAAWPIAQDERDFITDYLRQDVPDNPQQARQMLRVEVLARVHEFNDGYSHRDDAYQSVDAVLARIGADTGTDIARAVRLAQELGDEQLSTSVHNLTLGWRTTELQALETRAAEAYLLLAGLGVAVSSDPPVGTAATQQVLQQLVDEGSRRYGDFMRRLDGQADLEPTQAERSELAQIGTLAAALRRSAAHLGWLPPEASPMQALPQESRQAGVVWSESQAQALFTRGSASGVGNNCWFDAVAQLSLNQARGEGDDARIERLAQRLRRAADRLGLVGTGEMFEDTHGQMHAIARALGVQVHAFGQLPDGALRLSPLESVGAPRSRSVYIRISGAHFEPMWPTWQAAPASPVSVKAEPAEAAVPARAPVYVETALDQARTAFHRELGEICDLTGELAEWQTHFDRNDMAIVRHDMVPMPENDHKFPLRDPADALGRAHPRYADKDGNVHPRVGLRKMQFGSGFRSYFRELVKSKDARLSVDPRRLPEVMTRVEEDAARELQRLIRGEVGPPRCTPRLLRDSDVQPHERMLVGQHGLFVPRPEAAADRPTLSNGRILGFYMGALVENDHELAQTASLHPDYERYAIDAHPRGNGRVMYSGLGATNSIAFANTALKADSAEPASDHKRLNSLFIEFDATLTDNTGKPRIERLVAMVALDNLFDDNHADAQVLADYGEDFLENFRSSHIKAEGFSEA